MISTGKGATIPGDTVENWPAPYRWRILQLCSFLFHVLKRMDSYALGEDDDVAQLAGLRLGVTLQRGHVGLRRRGLADQLLQAILLSSQATVGGRLRDTGACSITHTVTQLKMDTTTAANLLRDAAGALIVKGAK